MIMVVKENSVPVYELKCCECKSVLRYTKADEHLGRITCPVCNMSNESFAVHPIDHVPKSIYCEVKPCSEEPLFPELDYYHISTCNPPKYTRTY